MKYYIANSEGKDYFEINEFTGEIFTKIVFDREKYAAYALAIEARDSAPSARPNSNGQPNTGKISAFVLVNVKISLVGLCAPRILFGLKTVVGVNF